MTVIFIASFSKCGIILYFYDWSPLYSRFPNSVFPLFQNFCIMFMTITFIRHMNNKSPEERYHHPVKLIIGLLSLSSSPALGFIWRSNFHSKCSSSCPSTVGKTYSSVSRTVDQMPHLTFAGSLLGSRKRKEKLHMKYRRLLGHQNLVMLRCV